MPRLRLSSKILLYFLVVSLLPLIAVSFVLVSSANSQLLKAASAKQQAIANGLASQVNDYLVSKKNNLVYQARVYSAGDLTATDSNQNLAVLLSQDQDIQRVAIVGTNGMDQVVFNRSGQVHTLDNESSTDAFKAVNFLGGKSYISSVSYNSQHRPLITIAVPILQSNFSQHLSNLSGASFGTYHSSSDIEGAIIANYNINDLWKSVLSTKIGHGGYAYVVDGLGNLVAHPNNNFLVSHQKLSSVQAVQQFTSGNLSTRKTISETGQVVISTPRVVSSSGWAVIVEEPTSSIYSGINAYIKLSTTIGISAIVLSILISIFFRKQLIGPINKLSHGAKRMGSGQFDEPIVIKSHDELQDLADTFNKMGSSIKKLVGDLQSNNVSLLIEQTKLNDIISSVSDGVVALNSHGEIVSINPPAAKLINGHPAELRGKQLSELFHWERDNKPFMPELEQQGTYHYGDLTLTRGNTVQYLDLMVSVLERKNSDVAVIITIHDLTQSRELDFMKLDFVAIAAHELRTPLTVVRGYLDMLSANVIKRLTILDMENYQKAVVGTDQLRDLINKLLNIARIERGEMEIFIDKLNLSRMVEDNVTQHQPMAIQQEQHLSYVNKTDRPVYVPADPASITEVLNNLIGNAIKYTGTGGNIEVKLEVNDQTARVSVADNGPGIPAELRARLFTKFYRAERSLIAGTRGTGLGLFISKTIIELQDGKIGIEEDRGKGSTFFFTLPVYDPAKHDKLLAKNKQAGGIRGWFKKRSNH